MEIKIFESLEFGSVRSILRDGDVWFISKDISNILGYSDNEAMTRRLDLDEKEVLTLENIKNLQIIGFENSTRGVSIINESGLYNAIIGSSKSEAKIFKKWITSEVLPSIRKTGGYVQENRAIDFVNNWLPSLDENSKSAIASVIEENRKLILKIEEQKPKVEFTDKLLKSKDCILVRDFAKILYEEKINIGEKKLYKWLRDNNYLMRDNLPDQQYMKYFSVKENTIDTPFCVKLVKTTLVTPEGQLYFYSKLKDVEGGF